MNDRRQSIEEELAEEKPVESDSNELIVRDKPAVPSDVEENEVKDTPDTELNFNPTQVEDLNKLSSDEKTRIHSEEEEFIGESELAIIETIKDIDKRASKEEESENESCEQELKWIRELTERVPNTVKSLEMEFESILRESELDKYEKIGKEPVHNIKGPESIQEEQQTVEVIKTEMHNMGEEQKLMNIRDLRKDSEEGNLQEHNIAEGMKGLPADLKAYLTNRRESLGLCLRMLKRLARLFPQFHVIQEKAKESPSLKCMSWEEEANLKKIVKIDFAQKEGSLKKDIAEIRNYNYNLLREKRALINEMKSSFYGFFQRYFFPIIDGLDTGKKFFDETHVEWLRRFPDQEVVIKQHSQVYDLLVIRSDEFLRGLYIEQIPVAIGEIFDEQQHDPFMVEEDKELKNNQIKEINQKGYQLTNIFKNERYILRAPQVVVVKNK